MNIQRYSLNDGDGIRTIVFLKGCPLRCLWCSNPESQAHEPEMMFDKGKCINCGNCEICCPTNARETIGLEMTVEEVMEQVEKDGLFYDNSTGGLTISGGEALLQWEFTRDLAKAAKESYFNVALETCGFCKWSELLEVSKYCDRILFDIKQMDPILHKRFTGVSNDIILSNLKKLSEIDQEKIIIRVPVIDKINSNVEHIKDIGRFAKSIGIKEIHLLPYHKYGENKYKKLGREFDFDGETPDDMRLSVLSDMLGGEGLKVKIGG